MKISARGRYALTALTHMAMRTDNATQITVSEIADTLGISKIYLEQIFTLLKRAGMLTSIKGSQGGYLLARTPERINAYEIIRATEQNLFDQPEAVERAPQINEAIRTLIYEKLDVQLSALLQSVTLHDLAEEAERHNGDALMYFI